MPTDLGPRFGEALGYALRLHGRQLRKGTDVPYVSHLLAVCSLVLEMEGDEDEAIAALLHDAVEDQGGQVTLTEIRRRFGDRVAEIVCGCSDTDVTPKPPWRARKEAYLRHLRKANPSVRRVSLADKIHNGRDILRAYRLKKEALWERFRGGKEGILWYYRSLAHVYNEIDPENPWVQELGRIEKELEREVGGGYGGNKQDPI